MVSNLGESVFDHMEPGHINSRSSIMDDHLSRLSCTSASDLDASFRPTELFPLQFHDSSLLPPASVSHPHSQFRVDLASEAMSFADLDSSRSNSSPPGLSPCLSSKPRIITSANRKRSSLCRLVTISSSPPPSASLSPPIAHPNCSDASGCIAISRNGISSDNTSRLVRRPDSPVYGTASFVPSLQVHPPPTLHPSRTPCQRSSALCQITQAENHIMDGLLVDRRQLDESKASVKGKSSCIHGQLTPVSTSFCEYSDICSINKDIQNPASTTADDSNTG
ncbi:unnamed protein product [Protopolystoma xenopodis]|uniref:Uncharacterized protein n=1 Tax=Protopolystoma xenopodis TaxID=117903 RepID=A0A3S5AFP9_9PLAT|nr:unnamed protein product [Protopolystoma xenopodis]